MRQELLIWTYFVIKKRKLLIKEFNNTSSKITLKKICSEANL